MTRVQQPGRRVRSPVLSSHQIVTTSPIVWIRVGKCGSFDQIVATAASLRQQIYPHWQMQIPRDHLTPQQIEGLEFIVGSKRLGFISTKQSRTDVGAVVLLLPGDVMSADALAEFVLKQRDTPDWDLLYADQIDRFGHVSREDLFFKPAWSPEFLLSCNYIGRAVIHPRHLPAIERLGDAFDPIDLWRLYLDLTGSGPTRIGRIERPLFVLRSEDPDKTEQLAASGLEKLAEVLRHRGMSGQPYRPTWAINLGVLVFDIRFPDVGPRVSILIPTRNNWKLLHRCIASLKLTTYKNYEIQVIDNESDDPETVKYLQKLSVPVLKIPSPSGGFSYSFINNAAAHLTTAEYLLFLNDDTEIVSPEWLSQMAGWLQLPEVASVGARLIYPNGLVQHAGIAHALLNGSLPAPMFRLLHSDTLGPHGQDRTLRNCSAVSAACMLTPRALFLSHGGFDESDFKVAYNDCDYGFRLIQKGYRHVFAPSAELLHFEGATRGRGVGNDSISEEIAFIRKYRNWSDPYLNRNLSRDSTTLVPGGRTLTTGFAAGRGPAVAVFSHSLSIEGAPLVLVDIMRGLKTIMGCELTVISLVDGPLRKELEADGIEVLVLDDVDVCRARVAGELEEVLKPVVAVLRERAIEVVIGNTVLTHWGIVAGQMAGLPSLWIIHESEPPFSHLDSWGELHLEHARRAFRKTYANVFVSESTRELYKGLDVTTKLHVVYNGFDCEAGTKSLASYDRTQTRRELGYDADMIFLMPATVCERKAQIDLVRALRALPEAPLGKAAFLIVGDRSGEYSDRLHSEAAKLGALRRGRLQIIKETRDIWRYYAAADALVFTSHLESFPRSIQEAMFCALPIVSTPVFGISEQLRHEQTALFFEPGDIGMLSSHLQRLIADPALRARLGKGAKLAGERFPSVREMQLSYIEFVREAALVGAPRGDRPFRWYDYQTGPTAGRQWSAGY